MSDPNKMLMGLVNGIVRLDYYDDSTITEELLKQELYPDESSENFVALLRKIRTLIKVWSHKAVGLKIEIHEIHQNLRNPVSILIKFHPLQQNPLICREKYLNPT